MKIEVERSQLIELRSAMITLIGVYHADEVHDTSEPANCKTCRPFIERLQELNALIPMTEPEQDGTVIAFAQEVFVKTDTNQWARLDDDEGYDWDAVLERAKVEAKRKGLHVKIMILREGWGE